ncbi:MAG TPA: ATP-dependent DNA helicase RecQ [Candidatus Kapabacteria bacterium]|nr:ATP-dependent DNA helicase RecQ [Candidatus Kapabacteria bacterium]
MLSELEIPSLTTDALDRTLATRFHLDRFRPMQREAIENTLARRDTLVIMPTGGGKSLCYQLPALLLPGITLVVSPLIALMKDQVDHLRELGISAIALNSTLTYAETRALVRRAQSGDIKVIFVAPERLESYPFVEELAHLPISLLAIDEAHCISQWGHDFRTSYRRIPDVYVKFSNGERPPVIALTATATPEVRVDISQLLQLRNPLEIVTGFERPNLAYGVLRECDKDVRLRDILQSVDNGSAIVYAATRKSVDRIAADLRGRGIAAESYHAGLPLILRRQVQERYQSNETRSIVATSAFGMGVDKPDVRVVVHYDIPGSIEAYYQESGRAGRDGAAAHAILFFNERDRGLQESLLRANSPAEADVKAVYNALHEIACTPVGAIYPGMLAVQSSQILDRIPRPPASMESIVEALVQAGHVTYHRGMKTNDRPRMRFTATRARLDEVAFKSASKSVKNTISALLRTLDAEAFERDVFFDLDEVLVRHGLEREEFKLAIRTMEGLGLVRFTPAMRTKSDVYHLSLTTERVALHHLDVGGRALEARFEANVAKLDAMVAYAAEWNCRQSTILRYFGERSRIACGVCDVCCATSSRSNR